MSRYWSIMVILILVCVGCGKIEKQQKVEVMSTPKQEQKIVDEEEKQKKIDPIEEYIKSMTLEQKVGQLFMPAFRQDEEGNPIVRIDENIKKNIEKYSIGGVILFSENIQSTDQTKTLIANLQQNSDIPLLIGVDEEGGIVSRISKNPNMGVASLPCSIEIGKTKDPKNAYKVGESLGKMLSSFGFNMNFAPVADVNTNPENPVIGERAFGNDPQLVAKMVVEEVRGIQQQNVSAVLKHFPGHGDTSLDTHNGTVILQHDINRLKDIEFIPFQKGIEAGVDAVMVAHIQVPKVEPEFIPATISHTIITDLLREQLGFDGVVITDALEMKAITDLYDSGIACKNAIQAGVDILLMPASLQEGYEGVIQAVKEGEISRERIDESVKRILELKQRRGLLNMD